MEDDFEMNNKTFIINRASVVILSMYTFPFKEQQKSNKN